MSNRNLNTNKIHLNQNKNRKEEKEDRKSMHVFTTFSRAVFRSVVAAMFWLWLSEFSGLEGY